VAVELLVLLLRIVNFSGSNLSTEIDSHDCSVCGSSQSLQANTRAAGIHQIGQRGLFPELFPIHYSLPPDHYTQILSVSPGFAEKIMPILRILCYNGSLVTRTAVSLNTANFKPLIFSEKKNHYESSSTVASRRYRVKNTTPS
jgi:hypothetical protein